MRTIGTDMLDRVPMHQSGASGTGDRGVVARQAARKREPMGGTGPRGTMVVAATQGDLAPGTFPNDRFEGGEDVVCEGPV